VRSAIISIEGAPGVGKSTIAAALARLGAFVVPEVNQLFAEPKPEPPDWYYDRQNARWEMAQLKAAQGRLAVLDGDPFSQFGLVGFITTRIGRQFLTRSSSIAAGSLTGEWRSQSFTCSLT
jgi:predicted ATPase